MSSFVILTDKEKEEIILSLITRKRFVKDLLRFTNDEVLIEGYNEEIELIEKIIKENL